MSDSDTLRIEYIDLAELRRWPRNPKEHDLGALTQSFERFGFVSPLIVDETTGRLVAGHGRIDALQQRKASGQEPPERIHVQGDTWLVPVIRGIGFANEDEASAYVVTDNRIVELGGWDERALAEVLSDLAAGPGLDGIGYDTSDLDDLLAALGSDEEPPDDPGAQVDRAAELQEKWGTERGQVWQIGRHRIMCGDSTSAEDVGRLLGDSRPHNTITDPPYGVEYDPEWRQKAAGEGHLAYAAMRVGRVENDDCIDWTDAFLLSPSSVVYCWFAGLHSSGAQQMLESAGFAIRSQIIWSKPHFPISRGDYHWRHEPCWYAVRKGHNAGWIGDRKQTTVWEVTLDKNVDGGHSTQKPVALFTIALGNHDGDLYDPFIGTGTAIVASEQLGRAGYGMDIEPAWIAVTLERLSGMGLEPQKLIES